MAVADAAAATQRVAAVPDRPSARAIRSICLFFSARPVSRRHRLLKDCSITAEHASLSCHIAGHCSYLPSQLIFSFH